MTVVMVVTVTVSVIVVMVMVVIVVMMVMVAVRSTDELQGLFQNSISDFHAADCLIEQCCQFLVSILSRLLRPLPEIFSVMVIVFNPMGQQYPQLVDSGFLFHFLESSCFFVVLVAPILV
jgi:hypothetical protein